MRTEPQSHKLSERAIDVVQNNCIRCHENQVTLRMMFRHRLQQVAVMASTVGIVTEKLHMEQYEVFRQHSCHYSGK